MHSQEKSRKASWFKAKPNWEPQPGKRKAKMQGGPPSKRVILESVIFIPFTPHRDLEKAVQKAEDNLMKSKTHGRVRVVERGGMALENLMCNRKPWT